MNSYKKAQGQWGYIAEQIEKNPPLHGDKELNDSVVELYQDLSALSLRNEEIKEIGKARRDIRKNMKVTNPKYFIDIIKNFPQNYPNISMFSIDTLKKIWDVLINYHYTYLDYLVDHLSRGKLT